MRNAPDMIQPYGPIAHSLIVCQEGSRSGLRKISTISRIWYERIAPIASRAALVEMGTDLFVSTVLVMGVLLWCEFRQLTFHVRPNVKRQARSAEVSLG